MRQKLTNDVSEWIDRLASSSLQRTGADIRDLLAYSLGRVVLKQALKEGSFDPWTHSRFVPHIVDWLSASKLRGEPWLSKPDANGRPAKLMKFGSVAAITAEADKAMRIWHNEGATPSADGNGPVEAATLSDGWRIVELDTPELLDGESARMDHCVGYGSYDKAVADGSTRIFSLRDKFDKSHLTVEVRTEIATIIQIQAKGNSSPRGDYLAILDQWHHGFRYGLGTLPSGFIGTPGGRIIELAKLVPGDIVEGGLELRPEEGKLAQLDLPENLTINGDLLITYIHGGHSRLQTLPRGLVVTGNLEFRNLDVELGSITGAAVEFRSCRVEELPRDVEVPCVFENCYFTDDTFGSIRFADKVTIDSCMGPFIDIDTVFEGGLEVRFGKQDAARLRFADGYRMASPMSIMSTAVEFGQTFSTDHGIVFTTVVNAKMPGTMEVGGDACFAACTLESWPGQLEVRGTVDIRDTRAGGRTIPDTNNPGRDERWLAITKMERTPAPPSSSPPMKRRA